MSQNTKLGMEELYAKLTIEDKEKRGVIIGARELQENKETFCLSEDFSQKKH